MSIRINDTATVISPSQYRLTHPEQKHPQPRGQEHEQVEIKERKETKEAKEEIEAKQTWVMFRTKSGRGWWICPTSGEPSQPIELLMREYFRGPTWWNESRLCYVLPSKPGLDIWSRYHGTNPPEQEPCGNLDVFPRHNEFRVKPTCAHVHEPRLIPPQEEWRRQLDVAREEEKKVREENKQLYARLQQLHTLWTGMQQHLPQAQLPLLPR